MPKSKEYVSDSDDSSEESKKKKPRQTEDEKPAPKKMKKEEEETIWDLGNNRQVNVRDFKGKYYVDIREMYYDKEGDLKPGKKGNTKFLYQINKILNLKFHNQLEENVSNI
ncbi:hypothetical protein ACFW04_009485 [Cataglyphis niger]